MEPALIPGDIIVVSKLNYGARLVNVFKFFKQKEINYLRTPGLGRIKKADVFVFNSPEIDFSYDSILNNHKNISVKRCYATPGNFAIIKWGVDKEKFDNSNLPRLFPLCYENLWSLSDYGPLYVPARCDSIKLTHINIQIYKSHILNEDPNFQFNDSIVESDDEILPFYKFKYDYYFVLGDNFFNSIDSRHWGFVCEKDIIGKVLFVLFSLDDSRKGFKKIRFDRIFKCKFETTHLIRTD